MDSCFTRNTNRNRMAFWMIPLLFFCKMAMVDGFLPSIQSGTAFQSTNGMLWMSRESDALSAVSLTDRNEQVNTEEEFVNPSIAAKYPREFEWWNDSCDVYLDELEEAGGVRFVAFHDEDETSSANDGYQEVVTNNWLHVTSSSPRRRVQYEMRCG